MRPEAAAMKSLLDQPGLQLMLGCGDGLSARLTEAAGFKLGFVSGSSVSALRLAQPDMDLLTFSEMRDAVEVCTTAAPGVLWLADGDTGYGNEINLRRTIEAYAKLGAAAVLIEDKAWPRPLGHQGAKLVCERDQAHARCKAALEACREHGILLLARTDARTSRGFDEARWRLDDFVSLGADIFFLDSPQSEQEMRASVEACGGKPMISVTVQGGRHFMPSDAELERIGIKIAVYPQAILAATVHGIQGALAGLKGGGQAPTATAGEVNAAIRLPEYLALDTKLHGYR